MISITLAAALILDWWLGEPRHFHPLIGFGAMANQLETRLNRPHLNKVSLLLRGAAAWGILVMPIPLTLWWMGDRMPLALEILLLYLALGHKSLFQHGMQVYRSLAEGDLAGARRFTGFLVSRDTESLDDKKMARATVESMLENGHDAVLATLFWYSVGGLPMAVGHRLANTLDAMWGYRTAQFRAFGFVSAKMDDLMGRPSAVLTTMLYAVQGKFWRCVKLAWRQGSLYKSFNGGLVMASGAAALKIRVGGCARYFGEALNSPLLGAGKPVKGKDIPRSLRVVRISCFLWVGVVMIIEVGANASTWW